MSKINENKLKTYTIAMTSMFGTYIAGKFKAKNGGGACSKARKKFGKEWTYYVFNNL